MEMIVDNSLHHFSNGLYQFRLPRISQETSTRSQYPAYVPESKFTVCSSLSITTDEDLRIYFNLLYFEK